MSSHHFVKEKQEPALLILSDESIEFELLGQLLEWCPIVVVDEHALFVLSQQQIKIDVVMQATLSDEEIYSYISNQDHVKVIKRNEDEDPLQFAIQYLINEEHTAMSIVACSENRFLNLLNFNVQLDLILYNSTKKIYLIQNSFKKWKVKNSIFKIKHEGNINPSTKNLKREEEAYLVMEDGIVEIISDHKLIIEELG